MEALLKPVNAKSLHCCKLVVLYVTPNLVDGVVVSQLVSPELTVSWPVVPREPKPVASERTTRKVVWEAMGSWKE